MLRALLRVAGILAIVGGAVLFLLAVTIGDCAAFGGTCPRPGVNDDVVGTAAVAGALAAAGFVFVLQPRLRSWLRAVVVAVPAAVVAALIAHGATSS